LGVPWFDLASLAKPLVTAPLALAKLDLDLDRREQLGFTARVEPLTVRQLLSHSAGLPPWLPFTGEPLAQQLARGFPAGAHPKLVQGTPGVSLYSDLGYRLLAELLERETGRPFASLGAESSGLAAAPWPTAPPFAPQGPDAEMWRLAEPGRPFPQRDPYLPNDANARAGMRGHAGFAASPSSMKDCLRRWLASGVPVRMAVDTASGADGSRWGLGLQRALRGAGRYGELLAAVPPGISGLHLLVQGHKQGLSPVAPALDDAPGGTSAFWFHLGFTGPALFFRPEDGLCIAILAHRVGPSGALLDAEQLRARRWEILAAEVARLK
jgi:CubicO group peptidase (beta-lactamase class C family)